GDNLAQGPLHRVKVAQQSVAIERGTPQHRRHMPVMAVHRLALAANQQRMRRAELRMYGNLVHEAKRRGRPSPPYPTFPGASDSRQTAREPAEPTAAASRTPLTVRESRRVVLGPTRGTLIHD